MHDVKKRVRRGVIINWWDVKKLIKKLNLLGMQLLVILFKFAGEPERNDVI